MIVGSLLACQDGPFALVFVEDPEGLARGADRLVVLDPLDLTVWSEASISGRSFPMSVSLVDQKDGLRRLALEARLKNDQVLGRGLARVRFNEGNNDAVVVALGPSCVSFRCGEAEDDECTTVLDHGVCVTATSTNSRPQYCDRMLGCQPRPPCDFDADGVADVDDDNPCTLDGCSSENTVLNIFRPDGALCSAQGVADGECHEGACILRRPRNPVLLLRDRESGSAEVVLTATVTPEILNVEENIVGFHLSQEWSSPPPSDDAGWVDRVPDQFVLRGGLGSKVVYLWVRDSFGTVNAAPSSTTVLFSPGVMRLGSEANGCPRATGGPCTHVWPAVREQAVTGQPGDNVLQARIDAAEENSVIWLYSPPENHVYVGRFRVTKSMTIQGAPGETPSSTRVHAPEDGNRIVRDPVFHLLADGITLRDFVIVSGFRGNGGVSAVRSPDPRDRSQGWTGGHLIERMVFEGAGPPSDGSLGDVETAIRPGRDSTVRSNWFFGWWKTAVDVSGRPDLLLGNTRLLHNTVVLTRADEPVLAPDSENIQVRNNIFINLDERDDRAAILANGNTRRLEVDQNLVAGRGQVVEGFLGALIGDTQLMEPKIVHMRDPRLAAQSPAIDGAVPDEHSGALDLFQNPRSVGLRPDVGAVESAGELLERLGGDSKLIKLGVEPLGCPSPAGRCSRSLADADDASQMLAEVFQAARPGSVIEVYDDAKGPAQYVVHGAVIDRTLSFQSSQSNTPGAVTLSMRADSSGSVRVLQADDVRISGFNIRCNRCLLLIHFHLGQSGDPEDDLAARRGVIERLRVWPEGGSGFEPGHQGIVRSNLMYGAATCSLVRTRAKDVFVLNNTFRPESYDGNGCSPFRISGASGLTAANNLIDVRAGSSGSLRAAQGDSMTLNEVFVRNQFFGFSSVSVPNVSIPPDSNCASLSSQPEQRCASLEPGFVDPDSGETADFHVVPGSPPVDAGQVASFPVGALDLEGRSRIQGQAIDVGALEQTMP